MKCMYCGEPLEAFAGGFTVEGVNVAYHDVCPSMYDGVHRFEYEKRLQHAIVDAAIDWIVNHIYDEIEPAPYDEIIKEAIKNTPTIFEENS